MTIQVKYPLFFNDQLKYYVRSHKFVYSGSSVKIGVLATNN